MKRLLVVATLALILVPVAGARNVPFDLDEQYVVPVPATCVSSPTGYCW